MKPPLRTLIVLPMIMLGVLLLPVTCALDQALLDDLSLEVYGMGVVALRSANQAVSKAWMPLLQEDLPEEEKGATVVALPILLVNRTGGDAEIYWHAHGADEWTVAAIKRWSRFYEVDVGFALCVAQRESEFNAQATGDDGRAVGLYQFWMPTWRVFRKEMGLLRRDQRLDREENIKTALWAFSHGYRLHWAVVKAGLCP